MDAVTFSIRSEPWQEMRRDVQIDCSRGLLPQQQTGVWFDLGKGVYFHHFLKHQCGGWLIWSWFIRVDLFWFHWARGDVVLFVCWGWGEVITIVFLLWS